MTAREIVLAQINHQETPVVPYTLPIGKEVRDKLTEHSGTPHWEDGITYYIFDHGGMLSNMEVWTDDMHYRDPFGTLWRNDEEPAAVAEPALKNPNFDGYKFPTADELHNPEGMAETIKAIEETPDTYNTLYPGVSLWQTWYLRGFEQTMMDLVIEEDFYKELLDRMTELILGLVAKCEDVPADALFFGDDWGVQRGVMIGPERWRELFKPRYARIFDAVHAQGKHTIMHSCGSCRDILDDMIEIGLDVWESVQPEAEGNNPYELKKKWGDKITFWGCLGSQSTIPFGTPDELRAEIRKLKSEMSKGGGYILAPAKPLRPETPTENAVVILEEFIADGLH